MSIVEPHIDSATGRVRIDLSHIAASDFRVLTHSLLFSEGDPILESGEGEQFVIDTADFVNQKLEGDWLPRAYYQQDP